MKVFLATNNAGKVERFQMLLKHIDPTAEVVTPKETVDVAENSATLSENAEQKVRAYAGMTELPILGNDTGFYVEGEGLIGAPKRKALGDLDEHDLSQEEVAAKLVEFWKSVAAKHGGRVDAAWVEAFVVLFPNGELRRAESRREIILTDQEFGAVHPGMPVRALYYSKATNKPAAQHTEEEELIEMQPVIDALRNVLGK